MYIKINQVQILFWICVVGSYMHGVLKEPQKNPAQEDEKMRDWSSFWARFQKYFVWVANYTYFLESYKHKKKNGRDECF